MLSLAIANYRLVSSRLEADLRCRNKNRLNRLADGFGAALGKHAEWRKPALSKTIPSQSQPTELGQRESLLTPGPHRGRSQSASSQTSFKSSSDSGTPERRTLADVEARYREESEMVRQAQEAVMQRPNFAIDAIGDSDGEDEGGEDDTGVMDEVRRALIATSSDEVAGRGFPQSPW